MATIVGAWRYVQKLVRMHEERIRSYPPAWAELRHEYSEHGVKLDGLKLRGIVQFLGATEATKRHQIDPHAAARWPERTPDLADRLRADPNDADALRMLAARGYTIDRRGRLVHRDGERGRSSLLWRDVARELVLYLRPHYIAVEAWDDGAAVPGRFVEQVYRTLLPYFPDVSKDQARQAIKDFGGLHRRR